MLKIDKMGFQTAFVSLSMRPSENNSAVGRILVSDKQWYAAILSDSRIRPTAYRDAGYSDQARV
ncbi:LuxR family transcriptional regulator [Neisseria wadsworthii 9715]|uniref:LuxR family transcriptional regulator n=1 Tax=Neisseria wadsworthii 9715 TaxID=1030841 RepID=G4CQ65_9NEIS|nr:LuxR family transcriptional regulator [Neisseria wadsworthii 9715]